MAASNILQVVHPEEPHDLKGEDAKDCIPCQAMASLTAMFAGAYFASGRLFKNDKDLVKNPKWWRQGIKGLGFGLIGAGIYRGGQVWLWDKDREYKKNTFFSK